MHRWIRVILLTLVVGLVAAACAGSGGGGSTPPADSESQAGLDPNNPTTIKVAETAGQPSAFLTWGQNQGNFKKYGLNLEIDTSVGGAQVIPGVVQSTYPIAGSNGASVLIAAQNDLPLQIIGPGTYGTAEVGKDFAAILVPADSDIQTAADLAGKTMAVNTLKNIAEVTARASLQNKGVDHNSVQFTEMPFPEMLAAMEQGEVESIFAIEPFVSAGLAAGHRAVVWPYVESRPNLQIGTFITSKQYMEQNPQVIEAFQKGLADTINEINTDPAAFRSALPQLARMEPAVAERVVLPAYKPTVDVASLQFVADKLVEYGIMPSAPDLTQLVKEGATG